MKIPQALEMDERAVQAEPVEHFVKQTRIITRPKSAGEQKRLRINDAIHPSPAAVTGDTERNPAAPEPVEQGLATSCGFGDEQHAVLRAGQKILGLDAAIGKGLHGMGIGGDMRQRGQARQRLCFAQEPVLSAGDAGAAMAAALKIAQEPGMQGKTIVVILPDSGERYLSSMLFSDMFSEQELQQ